MAKTKTKTSKWLKNFFSGKKDSKAADKIISVNDNNNPPLLHVLHDDTFPTTPISITGPPPKEKGRWSFRRSSATTPTPRNSISTGEIITAEDQQKHHALAVAAATAVAADAAVAAAQAAAAVVRLTAANATGTASIIEEAAAIKIQSAYRSYLARKALRALKGLVKLQALVRGHLVRKQAKATLRCMQTLVTLQAKVLAQRVRTTSEDTTKSMIPIPPSNRNFAPHPRFQQIQHVVDKVLEENIKIVEMDVGESKGIINRKSMRNSYSADQYSTPTRIYSSSEVDDFQRSMTPSALSEFSPRTCSGHLDDHHYNSFRTAQSSPHFSSSISAFKTPPDPMNNYNPEQEEYAESLSNDYFPSYMANTQSSRAKARSQSAPKQRPPEIFERQSSRRRPSMEGRSSSSQNHHHHHHPNNIPRAVRMQRSSSNLSSTAQNFHCPPPPWALKLDRSAMSVRDSECDSVSTMLTNTEYCRSLIGYEMGNVRKAGGVVVPRF